ncbi:JDVT-CTERM system glutamic-type intramembrane protease MrtJ [Thiomicrorhabdus chilensis]|uniref:JDVT-CTERM system glutamic-type intramembrane protease MrtJ n=1 Tax=Thiomicrorhabdus chilensis TaxID=63656 RepID=UPI000420D8CC|nr:JDVT-CTERM system glutamic-type intramembrane protease [Thiomicrorhabdus chilensis]
MNRAFWLSELGLVFKGKFLQEKWFYLALVLSPLALAVGLLWFSELFSPFEITWMALFIMVFWQPLIEELFFRGLLQGKLFQQTWFQESLAGISRANIVVSILFVATHFIYHPPLWALAVFIPSLIFGWFRDRYDSVLPSILLHAFYNASFLTVFIFLS